MPYHVKLDVPPIGYALFAGRAGEDVRVAYREFLSSEDGDILISRLEGFPTQIIVRLPPSAQIKASIIDHLLILIQRNGECIVYVNELITIFKTHARRALKVGETVFECDMIDIEELRYEGIEVSSDVGVFVVFSKGWRKGLYYDLGPLQEKPIMREYNFWECLGNFYNYLWFQDLFKISDDEYEKLFNNMWFPFLSLSKEKVCELIEYARNGWNPDDLLHGILKEVNEFLPGALERWQTHSLMSAHIQLLERATERFLEKDFMRCSSILYPRIEGILRAMATQTGISYTQGGLSGAAMMILGKSPNSYSRILPSKFQHYLQKVYFKKFDPHSVNEISRNTVAHGLAPQQLFSKKAAVIAILIIEQILFHLPSKPN